MITVSFKGVDNRVAVVTDSDEAIGYLEVEENGSLWFIRNTVYSSDDPVVYGFVTAFCGDAGRFDLTKFAGTEGKYEPKDAW